MQKDGDHDLLMFQTAFSDSEKWFSLQKQSLEGLVKVHITGGRKTW